MAENPAAGQEQSLLQRITADAFIRQAQSGRTAPILMRCETETETPIEVFCKLSDRCNEGVANLAREVAAACLAIDLGLPIPTPWLIDIPSELVSPAPVAKRLRASSPVAFGSQWAGSRFSIWNPKNRISDAMAPVALAIFLFDAAIENADRRPNNPNCLVSGDRIRIIDHELAFPATATLIGWKPPWEPGGLNWLERAEGHIFREGLRKRDLDFSRIEGVWSNISNARLQDYRVAIPSEWAKADPTVDAAIIRIQNIRDHMTEMIAEIKRVLA